MENKSRPELLEEINRLKLQLENNDDPTDVIEAAPNRTQIEKNLVRAQYTIDHAADAIFWINFEGHFEYVNESACKSLNYDRHELLDRRVFDIDPDVPEENWAALREEIKKKGRLTFRSRHKKKNGMIYHVDVAANFVIFDKKEYICAFVRDISERKRAELALYLSEQRFRAIADYTYDWELWISPGGRVLWTNPAVERVAGYTVEECMSMYNFPMCAICEDDRDMVERIFKESVKHESSGEGLEARLQRSDGKIIWVSISWLPIYDKKGVSQGYRASVRDITQRKNIQKEREELLKTLAAKNEELESIVYVSSHDLRTPLVNIQGFSGEMTLNCKEIKNIVSTLDIPEKQAAILNRIVDLEIPESINFIINSAKKIDALLDGLLRLSRIGRETITIEKLDMEQLFSEIREEMSEDIINSGAELTVGNIPKCMADRRQTKQVFKNLIDNSIKYLDPQRKGQVRVSGFVQNSESIYCIEDNGIGVPEEYAKVIFDIFQRLVRKENTPGEGLGLTIVKRIIARNKGRVWMESEEGKGTKFFAALPAAR